METMALSLLQTRHILLINIFTTYNNERIGGISVRSIRRFLRKADCRDGKVVQGRTDILFGLGPAGGNVITFSRHAFLIRIRGLAIVVVSSSTFKESNIGTTRGVQLFNVLCELGDVLFQFVNQTFEVCFVKVLSMDE